MKSKRGNSCLGVLVMMMTSFGSVVYGQMPETPPSDLPERDQEYQDCMADCEILSPESNVCSCKCAGGIVLNTNIPFIGRCIRKDTRTNLQDGQADQTNLSNAFPKLVGGLIRVVMGAVVVVGFLAVLIGGFMIAAEGAAGTKQKGLQLIKLAVAGLILVGLSGVILNLINPNFFKTASLLLGIGG